MTKKLKNPPPVDRLRTSGRSSLGKIDPTAGRYGAGLIPGVSLCSRGEALGHYSWIDAVMLAQIVEQCNANPKLIKSRFAHPDMCDDGTGKALGTIENASLRGDQAIGDLHLYRTAHNAPDGDLAGYVMQLAAEDPSNFGLSIVFEHDWEAEELFEAENTQETQLKDDKGNVAATEVQFVSPDPDCTVKRFANRPGLRISGYVSKVRELTDNFVDCVGIDSADLVDVFTNEIRPNSMQWLQDVAENADDDARIEYRGTSQYAEISPDSVLGGILGFFGVSA